MELCKLYESIEQRSAPHNINTPLSLSLPLYLFIYLSIYLEREIFIKN